MEASDFCARCGCQIQSGFEEVHLSHHDIQDGVLRLVQAQTASIEAMSEFLNGLP